MSAAALLPAGAEVPDRPEVVVRLWQVGDAEALTEAVASSLEHLRPFMPWTSQEPLGPGPRAEMIRERLAEWAQGGDAFYGIWEQGRAVGAIGAHHRVSPDGLEIGYWIRPDVEGRGVVSAAVRALTAALLELPGITHVEIRMDEANLRSVAVPQRCGYRLVRREARTPEAPAETGWGYVYRIGADPEDRTVDGRAEDQTGARVSRRGWSR